MSKKEVLPAIDSGKIPAHIAIIMDGNGRWATKRHLPRQAGHKAGMEALRRTIEAVSDLGVSVLTVYAFSTENWKRPEDEVGFLMQLLLEYLAIELKNLHKKNVRIQMLGEQDRLEKRIQQEVRKAIKTTENNTGLVLNIALNYGGRAELVRAFRQIAARVQAGELNPEDITEEMIDRHLYTGGIADPDLLIRTANEKRISNFLLWQIAYSELYVTDALWPDFGRDDIVRAIADYQKRDRRYGGLSK